jgi:phosphoribosylaminoimidazole-succinocarboxamide synthase
MVSAAQITSSLDNCIKNTDFLGLPGKRKGKVRDTYDIGKDLLIVTTDRLSAFDRVIAAIPFTGTTFVADTNENIQERIKATIGKAGIHA